MNKRLLYLLLGLGLVALSLGLIFGSRWGGSSYSWAEHYRYDRFDPYGTKVLYNLLDNDHQMNLIQGPVGRQLTRDTSTDQSAAYILIAEKFFLDSTDRQRLLHFAQAGNTLVFAATDPPYALLDSLQQTFCTDSMVYRPEIVLDSVMTIHLSEAPFSHRLVFRQGAYRENYYWTYFYPGQFCTELGPNIDTIGYCQPGGANALIITYGQGQIILHLTPLAFSNLSLKADSGLTYNDAFWGYLPQGPIYWDAYSMTKASFDRAHQQRQRQYARTPLRYILQQPPLAWAWYLLLASALCYLLFRAKRRQRIIPVLAANRNTSLEFLGTIGRLYFLQNDHKKLAKQDMRLFLAFVRNRYQLPTRQLDLAFAKNLSQRAQVPEDVIKKIVLLNQNIESSSFVSENTLVDFHRQIESFYQQCT